MMIRDKTSRTNLFGIFVCSALTWAIPTVPANSQEKVTLTFVRAGDSATVARVFEPILKAFEKENPNVTIKNIPMGFDEANRRFPLMAATGQLPDVMLPPDSLSATLGVNGAFLNLEKKISDDLEKDIPKGMWGFPCASGKGQRFGVPANAGALVLWYNVNVFKAAGLDPDKPPRTWDEFVAAAKQIEDKTDADGLGLNGFARNDIMDMFGAMVASRHNGEWYWNDEKDAVKVNAANAEALDFLRTLVANELTQASVDSYNRADTRSLLRDGKVGMTFDGPWVIGALRKVADVTAPDSPYRSTRLPGMTEPGATSLNISCYNISAKTKHPEWAVKFVEFLSRPEHMLTHAQGYGVVPVRTSMLTSKTFDGQPWHALAEAAAGTTIPAKPGVSNLSLVETVVPNTIQSVLLGKAKGKEALEALAREQGWK